MSELARKRCVPCQEGMAPLSESESAGLLSQLDGWQLDGWQLVVGPRLHRRWDFPDFSSALVFVNHVGTVAEAENHHPDITLAWGRVVVDLWTHAAGGLTENDFIVAAKLDAVHAASVKALVAPPSYPK